MLSKAGTGGSWTRRSGVFVFVDVSLAADPRTGVVFADEASGMGKSPACERGDGSSDSDRLITGVCSIIGESTSIAVPFDVCVVRDSLRRSSSSLRALWRLFSKRLESEMMRFFGRGDRLGSLYHSPSTGSVCTAASQYTVLSVAED